MPINFLFFPEFIFPIGIILILLISLFSEKNVFSVSSNLSIILLIILAIMVYMNVENSLFYFNNFFSKSLFINFFQVIVLLGSIATIVISNNYFKDLKLTKFEIPILILFSTFGMMIFISSNDLMSMYIGIELQSLALYVIASINRDSL